MLMCAQSSLEMDDKGPPTILISQSCVPCAEGEGLWQMADEMSDSWAGQDENDLTASIMRHIYHWWGSITHTHTLSHTHTADPSLFSSSSITADGLIQSLQLCVLEEFLLRLMMLTHSFIHANKAVQEGGWRNWTQQTTSISDVRRFLITSLILMYIECVFSVSV